MTVARCFDKTCGFFFFLRLWNKFAIFCRNAMLFRLVLMIFVVITYFFWPNFWFFRILLAFFWRNWRLFSDVEAKFERFPVIFEKNFGYFSVFGEIPNYIAFLTKFTVILLFFAKFVVVSRSFDEICVQLKIFWLNLHSLLDLTTKFAVLLQSFNEIWKFQLFYCFLTKLLVFRHLLTEFAVTSRFFDKTRFFCVCVS